MPSGAQAPIQVSSRNCRTICDIARSAAGLNLDPTKVDFIGLRVGRRLRALGIASLDDYLDRLSRDISGVEKRALVEALTTHTTSFFREAHQYQWLVDEGIDKLLDTRSGASLVLWSAACSTGVELWSAGMVLADAARRRAAGFRFELVGSDISASILRRAEAAIYPEAELAGLDAERRVRYMMRSRRPVDALGSHLWRVVPELRRTARFMTANLNAAGELPDIRADAIFLRNVLIYFDPETQRNVVDNVVRRLRPGGVLLTGHAEALPRHPALRTLAPSIYEKATP